MNRKPLVTGELPGRVSKPRWSVQPRSGPFWDTSSPPAIRYGIMLCSCYSSKPACVPNTSYTALLCDGVSGRDFPRTSLTRIPSFVSGTVDHMRARHAGGTDAWQAHSSLSWGRGAGAYGARNACGVRTSRRGKALKKSRGLVVKNHLARRPIPRCFEPKNGRTWPKNRLALGTGQEEQGLGPSVGERRPW